MKIDIAAEFARLAEISAFLDKQGDTLAASAARNARTRETLAECETTLAASRAVPAASADPVAFLSALAVAHSPATYRPVYLAAAEYRDAARRAAVFSAAVAAINSATL